MKITVGVLLFTALFCVGIFLTGCGSSSSESFSPLSSPTGTVSGIISMRELGAGTTRPLSGMQVVVVNRNYAVGTASSQNDSAVIASTTSNASGEYSIEGLGYGNYGVLPLPGPNFYRFSLASEAQPASFSINSESPAYTTSFIAADNSMEDSGSFVIRFVFKNKPSRYSGTVDLNRFEYQMFIQLSALNDFKAKTFITADNWDSMDFTYRYGWTSLFYTLSNSFEFSFWLNSGEPQVVHQWKHYVDLSLGSCPSLVVFEIDLTAHTCNRL
ncbi:MAG: carboxypeptidase-like regulatory domain-containing protein [Candidatus Ozemobacteraceae bacterium]